MHWLDSKHLLHKKAYFKYERNGDGERGKKGLVSAVIMYCLSTVWRGGGGQIRPKNPLKSLNYPPLKWGLFSKNIVFFNPFYSINQILSSVGSNCAYLVAKDVGLLTSIASA